MDRERVELWLRGEEETLAFGERFAKDLNPNTLLALHGDLGAGKTTFVKGLVRGLGGDETAVHSPTFTYLHCYQASLPVYHFDLYRFKSESDFQALGFEEYFENEGIVAIEWPERIAHLLHKSCIHLHFSHENDHSRRVLIR